MVSPSNQASPDKERFVSVNPGRDVQRVGTPRFLGQDPNKIYQPVWGVTGNLGDSQCYLGVRQKVEAIQASLARRIERDDLPVRLIPTGSIAANSLTPPSTRGARRPGRTPYSGTEASIRP